MVAREDGEYRVIGTEAEARGPAREETVLRALSDLPEGLSIKQLVTVT